jgi:hypothetical protein
MIALYFLIMEACICKMSTHLFWDTDPEMVDSDKNARWLIERVVQRGSWEDWLILSQRYGKDGLRSFIPTLRIDAKSANFLKKYCAG